ncbi:MAG: Spy/CpxP family protein refolding chaperone, partial [Spirochaetota bacterium]
MKMKRIIIAAGIIALSGTLLTAGCRHGDRCFGPGSQQGFIERIDRETAELNLTADQQKKYNEIRASILADRDLQMKNRDECSSQIRQELAKEKPDMAKIAATAKKMRENRPSMIEKYSDSFLAFYNMLDDAQKEKAVKKM